MAHERCPNPCNPVKVRGILCGGCNLALGHAKDNMMILEGLVAYLRSARKT